MSRGLNISVAMILLSAGSALAGTPMAATLARSVEKQEPLLSSMIWHCEGTTCTSISAPQGGANNACRAIARRFGQVVSFTSSKGELSAEQLAECNKGIEAAPSK